MKLKLNLTKWVRGKIKVRRMVELGMGTNKTKRLIQHLKMKALQILHPKMAIPKKLEG